MAKNRKREEEEEEPEEKEEEEETPRKGKEKAKSVVERIRKKLLEDSEKGGGSMPDEMMFIPEDGEKEVRFLTEFDEPVPVMMHDAFGKMFPQPCLQYYEKKCPLHVKPIRTSEQYAFTVYDYEMEQKKIYLIKATRNSILEWLLDQFDENGTITDRDIKIIRKGKGKKTHYVAKEMQHKPTKFEGKSKVAFTQDHIFKVLEEMVNVKKLSDLNGRDDEDEPEEKEKEEENGDGDEE